ncbi:MAG TPA: helix-turn-helix domain-containing protein [Solirubrobacteraceae bacterium]|nr:helix-turn-helix domain-containing protein [Solirubrobacteraceae bacterium]
MSSLPTASAAVAEGDPTEAARMRLVEILTRRRGELVDAGVEAIRTEISGYAEIDDLDLVADLRAHVDEHHVTLVQCIAELHSLDGEDLLFVRPHATKRVGRVPLASFMQAFRVYQLVFWRAVVEEATDDETRAAALSVAGVIMRYMNVAATHAAEVYVETERLDHARGEQVRRDLLEDLLDGHAPRPGPKLDAARAAGLEFDGNCLIVLARALSGGEETVMRALASSLARAAGGGGLRPFVVVRQEDVVLVMAAAGIDYAQLEASVTAFCESFLKRGVRLAVAASTEQASLAEVPIAYREVCEAVERLGPDGGVLVLPLMRAFDSLTAFGRDTASRLIAPKVRAFVAEDLAAGGQLARTLSAYVAADLSATAAADRLFVHVNTARYRLKKIEERTGCDLHRLADVLDLLVALSVAGYALPSPAELPLAGRLTRSF